MKDNTKYINCLSILETYRIQEVKFYNLKVTLEL